MKTIEIIQSEHQNLGAVLYSLEQLLELIDQGKQAHFSTFHGLLTYIDRFLNRYHHPKENEYLFPALLKRDIESADLIKELGRQHTQGDRKFVEVLKLLSAYEFGGEKEYPAFRKALLEFCQFERDHAELEEQQVLPRARTALEAADWERIDAAFGENKDPMFTPEWQTEFSELFDKLVNTLPAPLGLGESWK